MLSKKVLFLGLPNSGKTCIRSVLFEGEDPEKLLSKIGAPAPTYGFEHYSKVWIETDIGIVDTSGQELQNYLSEEQDTQEILFGSADIIIYVFDIMNWSKDEKKIIDNLIEIKKIKERFCNNAIFYGFCHKIDLIAEDQQKRIVIYEDIKKKIQNDLNITVIFTSIAPKFSHSLLRSMQLILNDLSKQSNTILGFLKQIIPKNKKIGAMLLDKTGKIVFEHITNLDQPAQIKIFAELFQAFLKTCDRIDKIDQFELGIFKLKSSTRLEISVLPKNKSNLAYLVFYSDEDSDVQKKIIDFIAKL